MAVSIISFLFVIGIGLLFVFQFLRRRQVWGIIIGIVLVLMALVPLIGLYFSISYQLMFVFGVAAVFVAFVLIYPLSGRNPRMLLLLGIPVSLLVQSYLYPLPLLLMLSVYLVFVAVILSSYDYSGIDITARMRNTNNYLRVSLYPFSFIQRLVTLVSHGRPTRSGFVVAYLMFQLATFLATPLFVAVFLSRILSPEVLMIAVLGYLYLSREGVSRGKELS